MFTHLQREAMAALSWVLPSHSGPHPTSIWESSLGRHWGSQAQAVLWTVTWMAPVLTRCRGLWLQTPSP